MQMMMRAGCALLGMLMMAGMASAAPAPAAGSRRPAQSAAAARPAAAVRVPPVVVATVAAETSPDTGWVITAAQEGLYFRLSSFIGSEYLALLPDGTYQIIAQSDFSAWATDTGKWRFSDTQGGTLTSALETEVKFADIDAGSFLIRVANRQDYQRLPKIRLDLEQFLQTQTGAQFTFSGNPGLAEWMGLTPRRDRFTRAEVAAAIVAIDTALASARPLKIPFRVCTDSGFTYVVSADTVERNLLLMNETRARDRIQRYGAGNMVAARIPRDEFDRMRRAVVEAAVP